MALGVVQSTLKGNNTGTTVTTDAITVTAGNLLVVFWMCESSVTLNSLTSSVGDSFTQFGAEISGGPGVLRCSYVTSAVGGSTTFTLTTGSAFRKAVVAVEISGASATPEDKTASTIETATPTSHNSGGTATTTTADEILVGIGIIDESAQTGVTDGSWVAQQKQTAGAAALGVIVDTRIVASTAAYSYPFTTAVGTNWIVAIFTFAQAGAVPLDPSTVPWPPVFLQPPSSGWI